MNTKPDDVNSSSLIIVDRDAFLGVFASAPLFAMLFVVGRDSDTRAIELGMDCFACAFASSVGQGVEAWRASIRQLSFVPIFVSFVWGIPALLGPNLAAAVTLITVAAIGGRVGGHVALALRESIRGAR